VPALKLISKRILNRTRLLDFLVELAGSPGDEARSLYLPTRLLHTEIENSLKEMLGQPDTLPELAEIAGNSKTGSVIFWSPGVRYLVIPAFPIREEGAFPGFATEPLHSLLKRDYLIALVLVRLGAYAIGICHGENLVSSKVGTGLVHGRHKKGGSSQQRFARHRDKQIEYFLSRVCHHAREQLEPRLQSLDYVVYGGAWTTIQLLQKQCAFLGQLDKHTLSPLLDTPEPRQAVLEKAVSRIWSSTVIEWGQD
jgi:hypothetical protein